MHGGFSITTVYGMIVACSQGMIVVVDLSPFSWAHFVGIPAARDSAYSTPTFTFARLILEHSHAEIAYIPTDVHDHIEYAASTANDTHKPVTIDPVDQPRMITQQASNHQLLTPLSSPSGH